MLGLMGANRFAWNFNNQNAPSTTPGTSVTPGASNAEGSWTQVASSANIANDAWGLLLWICAGNTTGNQKDHLLDVGVDPAGGTSYTAIISNIICGQSDNAVAGGFWYYFPIRIKSGSAVAVRIQGSNGTAGTVRVYARFLGLPSRPDLARVGQYSETIGSITGSGGVSFTPGTSGADGSWVSLGTTTLALWWWQLCVQCSNGTTTSLMYFMDLAYGDASNKHIIIEDLPLQLRGTAEQTSQSLQLNAYCEVPAGATLYVRGSCSGTPASGWNAVAVGIGG